MSRGAGRGLYIAKGARPNVGNPGPRRKALNPRPARCTEFLVPRSIVPSASRDGSLVMVAALLLSALACACIVAWGVGTTPLTLTTAERLSLAPPDLNINCGGNAVGRFQGEDLGWIVGDTDKFEKVDAVIGGAELKNEPMYHSHRYGVDPNMPWGYDIPVEQPGVYACTVHFAETATEAFQSGARVFHVSLMAFGEPVEFTNVDVYNATGGAEFNAYTLTAPRLVITRMLQIRVKRAKGSSLAGYMAGITCERSSALPSGVSAVAPPEAAGSIVPVGGYTRDGAEISGEKIDVNVGGAASGRFQAEDPAWIAYGLTATFGRPGFPIGGAEEKNVPGLRDTRFGVDGASWGYQIPIAAASAGIWDCTLHWAELIATMQPGERVFNVQVQDREIKNFDVIKATKGAEFTSTVLTFSNIPVSDVMIIKLTAVAGDPFLSAITCERSTAMTPAEAAARLIVRETANGVSNPTDKEPTVSPGDFDEMLGPSTDPAPSSTPSPSTSMFPSSTASMSPSSTASWSPSLSVSPSQSMQGEPEVAAPSDMPQPTDSPLDVLLEKDIVVDKVPSAGDNEVVQDISLLVEVPAGIEVDNNLKNALKSVLAQGSNTKVSHWALTKLQSGTSVSTTTPPSSSASVRFLAKDQTSLNCDMSLLLPESAQVTVTELIEFVQKGDATTDFQQAGYPNAKVSLLAAPDVSKFNDPVSAGSSSASTIVAVVVGVLLGVLVIVALLAFLVIRRNRRNEVNPAAFDAPPPALEDSYLEGASTSGQSDTAASVDYLDDDSTFTAATSRGADPEAGIVLDKDVWGRGSS